MERAQAQRPDDLPLLVDLGAAYRNAGQPEQSWPVLERALSVAPLDPAATLQLALTYEALGEWLDARLLYRNYLDVGISPAARRGVRDRLALLERLILEDALSEALAAERTLETAAPEPNRVLVLPFPYSGTNPDLIPLARVVSEAVAAELVTGGTLSVPDDNRVRLLLTQLEPPGDPVRHAQAVTSGARVLGAGRVLHGRMVDVDESTVRLEAELVDALTEEVIGSLTVEEELLQLSALAPRVAATVRALLELPPAPPSGSPPQTGAPTETLVAYGRGLLAEDRGDPEAAIGQYARAVQLDPRFHAARGRLDEARAIVTARTTTIDQMSALATTELPGPLHALREVRRLVPSTLGGRDPAAEVLGNEGLGRELILEIVVQPAEL